MSNEKNSRDGLFRPQYTFLVAGGVLPEYYFHPQAERHWSKLYLPPPLDHVTQLKFSKLGNDLEKDGNCPLSKALTHSYV